MQSLLDNEFLNLTDFLDQFDLEYLKTMKSCIGKRKFLLLFSENDKTSAFLYEKSKDIINKHKQVSFDTNLSDLKFIMQDSIRLKDSENLNSDELNSNYGIEIKNEAKKVNLADYIVSFYHLSHNQIKYKIEDWLENLLRYQTKTHSAQFAGKKILNIVTIDNDFPGLSKNMLQNEALVGKILYDILLKKMKENGMKILENFIILVDKQKDIGKNLLDDLEKILMSIDKASTQYIFLYQNSFIKI